MRRILCVICILCLVLTGCSKEEDTSNIVIEKEISLFEQKCLDLMLNLSGYDFENHRIVTRLEKIQIEKEESQEKIPNNQENLVKITDIIYENNILSEPNEPNWEQAKDLAIEIQDIFIDLKIDLKKNGMKDEEIEKKGVFVNSLVMNIKDQKKEVSLNDLSQIYIELYSILNILVDNIDLILVKRLYYDTLISFIGLIVNDSQVYSNYISKMAEDIEQIDNKIENQNVTYLKNRIKTILFEIQNLNVDTQKEICRLKLTKMIEIIPVMSSYSQKIDN